MLNGNPMLNQPYQMNSYINNPYISPFNNPNIIGNQNNEPTSNLIRVTGIEGAKAYQMQPNSTVALFDSNEDIMYIKSTDGAGFPTIRTFGFASIEEPKTSNEDFISREEFEQFKKEVLDGKQLISEPKSTKTSKLTGTK